MFGEVAVALLRLAGHSGAVPGAIVGEDVGASAERLKRAIDAKPERGVEPQTDDQGDKEARVSLRQRAYPLIELFESAARQGCDVMWSEARG